MKQIKSKWLRTNEPIEVYLTDSSKPKFNFNLVEKKILNKLQIVADKELSIKQDPQMPQHTNSTLTEYDIDWSRIIGYDDIKTVISSVISSNNEKKIHLLIAGAPGTSKTVFLKVLEQNLKRFGKNVHYLDSSTLSSSGVIEYLFSNNVQYCCLDEIDKLEKPHQSTFLNLLESGILQETKHKRIRKKEMFDLVTVSTANYLEKIIEPLLTRFMVLEIPSYTKDQFFKISEQLLMQQYGKTKEIANYITGRVWDIWTHKRKKTPNMRQCVQIAAISKNDKKQIDVIINTLDKYSKVYE